MNSIESNIATVIVPKDLELLKFSESSLISIYKEVWEKHLLTSNIKLARFEYLVIYINSVINDIDFGKRLISVRVIYSFIILFEDSKKYLLKFFTEENCLSISMLNTLIIKFAAWLDEVLEAQ